MLTDEIVSALSKFFEGGGPSHDQLDTAFRRFSLEAGDPKNAGDSVGKMKRVRGVLTYASDQNMKAGAGLVKSLLGLLRADNCFRPDSDTYASEEKVQALHHAFKLVGYNLDLTGELRPHMLESLEGVEMTDALWAYVRRARVGADDTELVIGTSKNLGEAAARHVLKERLGDYPIAGHNSHFPQLLGQAFAELELKASSVELDQDPFLALQEAIFLMAKAVNKLRNAKGDGHGRPEPAVALVLEGRLATQASAMVTELLLSAMGNSAP